MPWSASAEHEKFDEAVAFFASRVPYTRAQYDALDDKARAQAFYISGGLEIEAVQTVFDEVNKAIESGEPLEAFKKRVREKLEGKLGPSGFHLDTVFRNAVQTSYNTGRWYQLTDPELTLLRPYLLYDSVLDDRTTDVCRSLDGTCKAHDDPFWLTHHPLLHHRCRASLRSLRTKEAQRRGITTLDPMVNVPDGWGVAPPLRGDDTLKPKAARFDPEVWEAFTKRDAQAGAELAKANAEAAERRAQDALKDPAHWHSREYEAKYGDAAGKPVAWGRAMQERGRALTIADADALHRSLVKDGVMASPDVGELFAELPGMVDGEHKTVGELSDALLGAVSRGEPLADFHRELEATAAILGHVSSIDPLSGIELPSPEWLGRWTADDKRRIAKDHEQVGGFLARITDSSVAKPSVRIQARKKRASYRAGTIEIRGRERGADLAHEWGHALEDADARMRNAARAFLAKRTESEAPRRLRDLTGDNYKTHEIAKRDGFFHPYVGRIYPTGETEVVSVGLDWMRNGRLLSLYSRDPEHFWFVLGVLAGVKV